MAGKISRIILWTHMLYDLAYLGADMYYNKEKPVLRAGAKMLGEKIERVIESASANPETLLVIIEPEFKRAAPGALKAYKSIKKRCLKGFSGRVAVLPPEAGYDRVKSTPMIWDALEPFKDRFSRENLTLFYTGEMPGAEECAERAKARVVVVLKKMAGITIPEGRQHRMKRFSIKSGHSFDGIRPITDRLKRRLPKRPSHAKPRKLP